MRSISHRTVPSLLILGVSLSAVALTGEARAGGFATPPYGQPVIATSRSDRYTSLQDLEPSPRQSLVRFSVGPAGKVDSAGASPGLAAAIDLGRGPTGFRLAGAFCDVGAERGLSQYTAELTIDFGGRSRLRPVVGAGGGVARTSSSVRADGSLDTSTGATLGIGVVRAGLGYRLPFNDADARVALDVTGALPAIRTDQAPEITPWALASITVGIGF